MKSGFLRKSIGLFFYMVTEYEATFIWVGMTLWISYFIIQTLKEILWGCFLFFHHSRSLSTLFYPFYDCWRLKHTTDGHRMRDETP